MPTSAPWITRPSTDASRATTGAAKPVSRSRAGRARLADKPKSRPRDNTGTGRLAEEGAASKPSRVSLRELTPWTLDEIRALELGLLLASQPLWRARVTQREQTCQTAQRRKSFAASFPSRGHAKTPVVALVRPRGQSVLRPASRPKGSRRSAGTCSPSTMPCTSDPRGTSAVRGCEARRRTAQLTSASRAAVVIASMPVSSVGWITGAKRGLWLVGMSSAIRPASCARV